MKLEKMTRRERSLNGSTESIVRPKSMNNTYEKNGKEKRNVCIVFYQTNRNRMILRVI